MGPVPTPQLIEAAANLQEADRALLNLWIHRGLDDVRLGALTRMEPSAVQQRRERILTDLSATLGVPEADVLAALEMLASAVPPGTADAEPELESEGEAEGSVETEPVEPVAVSTEPERALEVTHPEPGANRRRRWIGWASAGAALVVIAAVLLIVLLPGGGSPKPAAVADRSATDPVTATPTSTTTTAADPPATSTTDPNSTPAPPSLGAFEGLPGGLVGASGQVKLLGHGHRLRLRLRVSHLPRARGGHYEAWLYTTVLDSRPLGRVRSGDTETFVLQSGASRFRFIDVSFQPRGDVNHSGESRLRTANPVRELRRHPRAARAHPRHALHPASAHRPQRAGARHDTRRASARHAAHHHVPPRAAHHHAHRRGSDSSTRNTR